MQTSYLKESNGHRVPAPEIHHKAIKADTSLGDKGQLGDLGSRSSLVEHP